MTSRRFLALLLLVGAAGAGLRLWHVASIRPEPIWGFHETWTSSDMYQNRLWAEHLAAGDWLDRGTFRARFAWQGAVADAATWDRWLGPRTYYQPPLYTYLLAAGIKATGSIDAVRWLQALLGAVNAILIGLLARRLAGPAAGLIAAAIAAAYAPFIFFDAELLRGPVVILADVLALLALDAASRRGARAAAGAGGIAALVTPERRAWILAGSALGAAYLADSAIVAFVPLAILWALVARPLSEPGTPIGSWRAGLPRAAALAAGILLALVPLMARNLAVGAPLLSSTTRGPLAFVMGNAPDAKPVGAAIPQSTVEILARSDYGLLATMRETIREHHGDWGRLIGMQFEKLSGLFNGYEVPDNPSFYYAALSSPVLRGTLRFVCVAGLGLAGLLLAARHAREWLLPYLFLTASLGLFLLAHVVSRYRQPIVIVLAAGAAFALVEAVRALRVRRIGAAAAILAGGVALSFALPNSPPSGYRLHRPVEFLVAAGQFESRGDVTRAAAEIRRAQALADAEFAPREERIALGLALGEVYLKHERLPEALSAFRDVVEEDPRNAEALAAMGGIYHDINQPIPAMEALSRAAGLDPDNAEVQARIGHLLWFVARDGEQALVHIRKALDLAPNSPMAPGLSRLAAEIAAQTGRTP